MIRSTERGCATLRLAEPT
jgi:hypothetical protein